MREENWRWSPGHKSAFINEHCASHWQAGPAQQFTDHIYNDRACLWWNLPCQRKHTKKDHFNITCNMGYKNNPPNHPRSSQSVSWLCIRPGWLVMHLTFRQKNNYIYRHRQAKTTASYRCNDGPLIKIKNFSSSAKKKHGCMEGGKPTSFTVRIKEETANYKVMKSHNRWNETLFEPWGSIPQGGSL